MNAYSLDLRQKVKAAIERGQHTQRELAGLFDVSRSFIQSLLRNTRTRGTIEAKGHGGGRQRLIDAKQEQVLKDLIAQQNDATLQEACEHLAKEAKLQVSSPTVSRALKRLGLSRKKKVKHAAERDEQERLLFRAVMAVCDPQRLVWIDEMGVNRAMTRAYGRAPIGQRAIEVVPGNRGRNVTVLAAGRLSGIEASMSFEGSLTAPLFEGFLEEVLLPTLTPGDIVLFDNLAAHVTSEAEEILAERGVEVILMPAYSPDLNPIELCWSKIKEHLRAAKARTREALDQALTAAFKSVSLSDWQGWFLHCGLRLSLD